MHVAEPLGHKERIAGLWRAARAGRLGHAFLFEGPAGIGKFAAAVWFAAGMLCRSGPGAPCGVCPPCKQVATAGWRGGHPDLLRIDPVEEGWDEIPIGAIAERSTDRNEGQSLAAFLSLRALMGDWRLVLVREAERLNEHAQNALLKTLEEPAAGTVIVLECSNPAELLATVRSRVVRLALAAPGPEVAVAVLEQKGVAAPAAHTLADLADHSPGEALRLERQGALELLDLLDRVLLPTAAAGTGVLAAAASLWDGGGDFGEGTVLQQARRRARLVLELGMLLCARARRVALGVGPTLTGPGGRAIEALVLRGETGIRSAFDGLAERRRDIDANLDPGAVIELALLTLAAPAAALTTS